METAIVMPAFIFILLGMLQLGLMHQGRLMAKYAAYKAARVGSIHSAKHSAMTQAALAVLLPYAGRQNSMSFFRTTPKDFSGSWQQAKEINGAGKDAERIVTVTICEPTRSANGSDFGDFDDPEGNMGAAPPQSGGSQRGDTQWRQFNTGRLSVQVTFYQRMVIPFANWIIWHSVRGNESLEMMKTLRLGTRRMARRGEHTIEKLDGLAEQGIYVMPIRANWSMRMQSNFLTTGGFELPTSNECRVQWEHGR